MRNKTTPLPQARRDPREVLARLLVLNAERAETERAAGGVQLAEPRSSPVPLSRHTLVVLGGMVGGGHPGGRFRCIRGGRRRGV